MVVHLEDIPDISDREQMIRYWNRLPHFTLGAIFELADRYTPGAEAEQLEKIRALGHEYAQKSREVFRMLGVCD